MPTITLVALMGTDTSTDFDAQFLQGLDRDDRGDDIAAADVNLHLGHDPAFFYVYYLACKDISGAQFHCLPPCMGFLLPSSANHDNLAGVT